MLIPIAIGTNNEVIVLISIIMKRLLFIFIISLVFITQVKAQTKYYFPEGNSNLDFTSKYLATIKEPIIFQSKSKYDEYRFTWLRSFDYPVVIRIEKRGDIYTVYWKEWDFYNKQIKRITDGQKNINKEIWDRFMNKLSHTNFWNMDINDPNEQGLDGAEWTLEGKSSSKYHVVERWSPKSSTDYFQCCDYLIGLTDLQIPENRKY